MTKLRGLLIHETVEKLQKCKSKNSTLQPALFALRLDLHYMLPLAYVKMTLTASITHVLVSQSLLKLNVVQQ